MSTSINDLPVEILIDVTRYLDESSLRNAILACQRWKNIVEKYCFWSISLYNEDVSYLTVRDLQATNRKFRIKVSVHQKFAAEIDIYKQIGCSVTELSWNFDGHSTCLEYLKYFPNLEHMMVCRLEPPVTRDHCGVLDLKKLKSLESIDCSHITFKYFGTSNIKSLNISEMSVTSQWVVNFIRRQKTLTKLTLHNVNDDGTFFQQLCHATPNGTVPFKLAHLGIVDDNLLNNYIGLDKFMKMQSETLKKLELSGGFSNSVFEIIFWKLTSLKFLRISLPSEIEFGENSKENLTIENLTLTNIDLSPLALHQFCSRLQSITNLYFDCVFNVEQLQIVSIALNSVTTLCVDKFNRYFEAIQFPNLTSIFIENLSVGDLDWTAFCKANSRITEMVIEKCFDNLKLEQIKMITRNLKLQVLKIGEGFSTNLLFLWIIRKNCPELKVLELQKSCVIKDLDTINQCGIPLLFCDEIKIPNEIRF